MAVINHAFQRAVRFVEQNDDVERHGVVAAAQKRGKLAQTDKLEARRKGEILLQQTIAVKVAQIVRQQRLLRRKALLL